MEKSRKYILIVIIMLCIIGGIFLVCIMKRNDVNKKDNSNEFVSNDIAIGEDDVASEDNDVVVLPTMNENLLEDSVWCPTFQLVWNDMKNEVVKKDIEFVNGKEPDYLDNLNEELFTEQDISEQLYYKNWGEKSNKLKKEIEEGIKDKFDETSDIIKEEEDWDKKSDEDVIEYVFYAMLKKTFNFLNEFDILEKGFFGTEYDNVEYFGIDDNSKKELKDQVTILYYNNDNDFAFSVATKENDEVIFVKKPKGNTFSEVYDNLINNEKEYAGTKSMSEVDSLKIPNLDLDILKDYKELQNISFKTAGNDDAKIVKALQSIKLKLNNKGGEIKSEAIIQMQVTSAIIPNDKVVAKKLYLNDEFVMFVKEKDKDLPYFALKVTDISKYQSDIQPQ